MALIVVGRVVLAACSNGDEPEATDATELDTSATPSESDFAEDADLFTLEFAAVPPASYRVDSLGTPFSVAIEGDWWVQPNRPGWTVFSAPESQGPSDDDVVFLRPTLLSDPTDPGACCDGTNEWPMDDIQGWLDNIVDGVVVSGPEDVEIGGLPAVTFEVEVTDSAPCGPDYEGEGVTGPPFCVGFIVSNVGDDGNIDGYTFEPGFRERVLWVDQGDQPPVVIIVGTRIDDPSFDEQADALLATLAFGDTQPHPIPDAGTPTTTSP